MKKIPFSMNSMARPLQLQYPDAVYHLTCQGNEQKEIFRDNGARKRFLQYHAQSLNDSFLILR